MTCEFCGHENATTRKRQVPPIVRYPEVASLLWLCADCWADLQEATTPRRQEP